MENTAHHAPTTLTKIQDALLQDHITATTMESKLGQPPTNRAERFNDQEQARSNRPREARSNPWATSDRNASWTFSYYKRTL
jgi:hypothetical protein